MMRTLSSEVEIMRKLSIALILALCTFSTYATSYVIVPGYSNRMCSNIRMALTEGLVLDATRPLCGRRFELSPKAKRLGLVGIEKTLMPSSGYFDLLIRMAQVDAQESTSSSEVDRKRNEIAISNLLKEEKNEIYASKFDADNSDATHRVYVVETTSCNIIGLADSPADVSTYIEKEDGSLDPNWGVHAATVGIPFIYKRHTYYLKWQSLKGSPDKRQLAKLDVYDSRPFDPKERDIIPYQVFTPTICEIFQVNK